MAKEVTRAGVQKRAPGPAPSSRVLTAVTPESRRVMICEAAYYIAEHRGFQPGHDMDDWLTAEQQIDASLTSPESRTADSRPQR